jgi:hypothetical protein
LLKVGARIWRLRHGTRANETGQPEQEIYDLRLLHTADAGEVPADWMRHTLTAETIEQLPPTLREFKTIAGPARLVERFLLAIGEQPPSSEDGPVANTGRHALPAPEDVPPFPQEGVRDPYGQNAADIEAAWRRIGTSVGRLCRHAHEAGVAATLPKPSRGSNHPGIDPWHTIVPAFPREVQVERLHDDRHPDAAWFSTDLDLVQRCLLTTTALSSGPVEIANLLEDLGYVFLSTAARDAVPDAMKPYRALGKLAMVLHERNMLHGDMHIANFYYDEAEDRAGTYDVGTLVVSKQPLTARERAQDLAVLKVGCSYYEWEAVKLGYRDGGPASDATLALL